MKVPKTLSKFIALYPELNLRIEKVKYRFKNYTFIGYDIVKEDDSIVVSIEPLLTVNHKWYFKDTHEDYDGSRYFKRLSLEMFRKINPRAKSFYKFKK